MKPATNYYNLYIATNNTEAQYQRITQILGVTPKSSEGERNPFDTWHYQIAKPYNDKFDFINAFMDIVEPKLAALHAIGIHGDDIHIWLVCELQPHDICALGFNPQEMQRISQHGISLSIDCIAMTADD